MAKLIYSPDALDELDDIYTFTAGKWGTVQAAHYVRGIYAACRRIMQNPYIGQACDHIRPGLRRMPQGSHVIFYEVSVSGILIVRILHGSMSAPLHLP